MPLFSSKFTFKKSPQRQRVLEEIKQQNDQKDDISSNESDDDDKYSEDEEGEKEVSKTGKRGHKTLQANVAGNIATKDLKSFNKMSLPEHSDGSKKTKTHNLKVTQSNKKRNQLVLCLERDICFHFDSKQGIWRDSTASKGIQVNKHVSINAISNEQLLMEVTNKNKILEEENRLLKLKIEILMEMVTETTAELNLKEKHPNNK